MHSITMRGKKLDMGRLIAQNSHKRAVGNANMNANGDVIGSNGTITLAREDIAREYHRSNPKAVKQVPLRTINQEVFDSPAEAVAKQKELIAAAQKIKRKIAE